MDENTEAFVSGQFAVGPGSHPGWLCAPKLKIMGYFWDRQVLAWGRRSVQMPCRPLLSVRGSCNRVGKFLSDEESESMPFQTDGLVWR